ncbi:galactose oxidase [Hyphopichia burtonii NRRL Y-1933]|uniref:Galactose oxidase n=1 Tax=Hyphopichia burtonii NRRL Y-1933 TaxID=984485 RepID=A0A1E4RRH1_9ASCO|nr:galactose oxidase [Hyphopichia burtonii NRRL Y-1933]ODV69880.1 galactose oxidase [Hyphopichia burtonii NRRL Y-1933]
MAKKDKKSKESKKARAAEKQKKNQSKAESKSKKQAKKTGEEEEDEDIDQILEQYAKEQEEFEAVNIEVCKRPSKRLNPTLVANPAHNKRELFLFGGECMVGSASHFYNDLYSYTIDNDTWRKISSKNSPLPRSSHAMCAHPSGVILLFGGEFSSPKQSTFYHYGDTWILDADTKEWTKIDQKRGPSARSGHRMCVWKNYIIMHGGFRDLGTMTTYLNDMWLFDITSYKWEQVEFPPNHPIPDARSGHSMIPCADGAVIYGGYCKVKAKKGLQKGKVLNDCWLVKMKADPKGIRVERRRKQGFNPLPRVGCSMVYHKNRGILFGGVFDFEESEEQIDSEFYNNLYSYQIETNRWYNLSLKPQRKKKQENVKEKTRDEDLEDILNSILAKANLNDDDEQEEISQIEQLRKLEEEEERSNEDKVEYPIVNKLPHERFNATTCVVDDVFYIYGGIFERGEQEFNLDSFYSIDLGKLDGVKVFWENLKELEQEYENSDDEFDEDDDEDDEDDDDDDEKETDNKLEVEEEEEEEEEVEEEEDEIPDPRPWLPHPKPFETLRSFYVRTGAQFLEWSISSNREARGKYLKKAAFDLCEERFWERREQVSIAEDTLEDMGGVGEVIEKNTNAKPAKRR